MRFVLVISIFTYKALHYQYQEMLLSCSDQYFEDTTVGPIAFVEPRNTWIICVHLLGYCSGTYFVTNSCKSKTFSRKNLFARKLKWWMQMSTINLNLM